MTRLLPRSLPCQAAGAGAPHSMAGSDLATEVATAEAWLRQAL